ncbi:ER membrane protein complex subunit 10-like isoform X1 [Homalodisca vitripennis]|uniref:ER membrane protein complex subunit 10-like isoform X1 n=1 Tax=Homalodisca vitripennis TaxID=197043 RepID=UPI001EEC35E8|nr:ER membrane protein complex subunit 10-like isoform X1 [Homalodisca vitripennis]
MSNSTYYIHFLIVILSTSVISFVDCFDSEYDGPVSIILYHSTTADPEPKWTERGLITIQNVVTGDMSVSQKPVIASVASELQSLSKKDGIYRIKSVVRTKTGKEISFLSFVKACLLVESYLSDSVTVSVDYAGTVIAVTLSPTISVCEGHPVNTADLRNFNTVLQFRHMEQGPMPDTAAYIQKLEREREARERGDVKDNRSFLAKYWIYIVPVVIFAVLSGASTPEAGGGR